MRLSFVKRYMRIAQRSESLMPRKAGGRPPNTDQTIRRLLEKDVKERPAATVKERRRFLEYAIGKVMSDSTVGQLLRGWASTKKRTVGALERDEFLRAAWRAMVVEKVEPQRLVFVDEMGANISLSVLHAWSRRGQRAHCSVPRNRGKNTTLLASMSVEGMRPTLAVEGTTTATVFEAYVKEVLFSGLRRGQIMIMDNLSAHKSERVKKLIEGAGCEVLHLPPYSPDLSPIQRSS